MFRSHSDVNGAGVLGTSEETFKIKATALKCLPTIEDILEYTLKDFERYV